MSSDSRPNIVFFFSDQQRWDTVGCYGQPLEVTPNLDRMASEGVRFDLAFTCQPVCGPARACLQTGLYATGAGCITNHQMPSVEKMVLAPTLAAAGYETAYIGKWHLASFGPNGGPDDFRVRPVPPERRGGFADHWLASDVLEFTSHSYDGHMFDGEGKRHDFPKGRYRADAQTDWAIEYLRQRSGERPFFLFLSYIEPHHQNDHAHFEGPHGSKERFADFLVPGDLQGTVGDWEEEYPDYLGCCASLDEKLGRLRAELERQGIADNTLILYTSDHGCHFRTRNPEYKRSCHDGSIRIPMVACGPGFQGGKVVEELVSLIDVPPTLVAASGADIPPQMLGRPLQALADGTATDWPKEVFLQISENHCGRAIRTARWKYAVRAPDKTGFDAGSDTYVEDSLYDLGTDPHERSDLVAEPTCASVRAELAATLKRRMVEAGEDAPCILPRPAVEKS
jgi:arylsulfatase A-like enzyme